MIRHSNDYRAINILLRQEDYETAIAALTDSLNQDKSDGLGYGYLGLAYYVMGEVDKAQAVWSDLLLSFDQGSDILVGVLGEEAHHRLQRQQFRVAQSLWEGVLDLAESPSAWTGLGSSLAQQGRFPEAIECWHSALNLDPSLVEVYHQLGAVHQALKEYDPAIAVYQALLRVAPGDGEGRYQLALCLQGVGQWQAALDCLNQGLALGQESGRLWGEMGMIFLRSGYPTEAFNCFQQMIQQSPQGFDQFWRGLGQTVAGSSVIGQDIGAIRYGVLNALGDRGGETDFYQQLTVLQGLTAPAVANLPKEGGLTIDGFYPSTQDWFTAQGIGEFWPGLPESVIPLTPPRTLDPSIHFSFRFGEGVALPASFVVSVPQGHLWLNRGESRMAVITPDNRLLGDLSPESPALSPHHPDKHPSYHSLLRGGQLPPVTALPGTIAVLSGLLNDVYFHWLFDVLPRVHLLQSAGWHWAAIDGFVVNRQLPFQAESLAKLGIPSSKVIDHCESVDCHLQADHLLVPSFPGTVAWMPQWACQFLRDSFVSPDSLASKPTKRIYIRRNQSSSRRLVNEDEIISYLSNFGFEAVNLERLSLCEQADLLAGAAMVIAPHGSGLSNIVFCQPNTVVIEIFSPFYVYPCYWLVSNLVGLNYYYVVGEIIGSDHFHQLLYPDSREEDIYLDCRQLTKIMALAGITV